MKILLTRTMTMTNADLPCATGKCPHGASCCKYGVDLTPDEESLIRSEIDDSLVQEHRTAIRPFGCVFLNDRGRCMLHKTRFYPSVCRRFPLDGYEGDPALCPEVKKEGSELR